MLAMSGVHLWSFQCMTRQETVGEQRSFDALDNHTPRAARRRLRTELESPTHSSIARTHVFFNAYIPKNEEHKDTPNEVSGKAAWKIISEQLEQIGNSHAARQGATIHITTVGSNEAHGSDIDKLCNDATNGKVECVFSQHIDDNGEELDTLQDLYRHCRAPENLHSRVVYMHNKGSYHPSSQNDKLRRAMTDAVTSQMCLEPQDNTCNVCGLVFSAPPQMYAPVMPGNFFTTSCDYVNELFPPRIFRRRMRMLIARAKQLINEGRFHFRNEREANKPWVMGSNRYAAEHWIGTHPNVRPCDLSTKPEYWYWENHDHSKDEFEWAMYPRKGFSHYQEFSNSDNVDIFINADLRLSAYTLLPGLLWRFSHLYNQMPPDDSWIFKLPDGSFWKDAIQKHGHRAVETITASDFDRKGAIHGFLLRQSNEQKRS